MSEATEARAFEALSRHARFAELVSLTRSVELRLAKERVLTWLPLIDIVPAPSGGEALRGPDAVTDFGNAWTALEKGPSSASDMALLRALSAHVLAETKTRTPEEEDELVQRVVWLAAFTPLDATRLLDRSLGESNEPFFHALGEHLRKLDAGEIPGGSRAEALTAAVALRGSSSPAAAREVSRLGPRLTDPALAQLLAPPADAPGSPADLTGELTTPPRSVLLTVVLALTGVLFVSAVTRALGRLALAYRRPAHVTLTATSVRVRWKTLILGRTVREQEVLLARQGLARAAREVRYPRVAFYAGLLSLSLGSLLGVRTFVDGVRAASPSLLFYGLVIVAIGVGLDFALAALGGHVAGKCRVVFVGRDGTAVAVRGVDATVADRALVQLSGTSK